MADGRFQQVEALFYAALDLPAGEREAYLREQAGGDESLLREAAALLRAYDEQETLNRSAAPLETPSVLSGRIGPYCIESLIGKGGMGAVYQARRADGHFDQQVAIKLIALPLATDFFRERFRQERQILATLDHPNITRLLDGGLTAEDDPYLVMEYVDGLPLGEYCDRNLLGIPQRIHIFQQVCSAVAYAHRNLIVHRDLKPSNILVTGEGVPKLLDFGTAKLLTDAGDASITRVAMLTPRYASPEQLRGEPVTTASDVYSLGTILYELLTGAWPYGDPGPALAGWERAARQTSPTKPSAAITEKSAKARATVAGKLARTLQGDLGNIVLKAIAPEAQRRYFSVEQFSDDLQRWLEGRPVLARPQTWAYRAARFVRRHWIAAPAVTVCILALAASAVYSAREARQARLEAAKAKAVTRFFQGMLASASPTAGGKKDVTVQEAMDQTRLNLWQLSSQPAVEAALHYSIGTVYLGLSEFEPAEAELNRALEMARRAGSEEDVAWVRLALGELQINVAKDLGAAEANLRETLRYVRRMGAAVDPELAHSCMSTLAGGLWIAHGHSAETESLYREAIRIARADARMKGFDLAWDLSSLGGYLIEEGRDEEATRLLNEALAIERDMPHPTMGIGQTLLSLGQIRARQGDLLEAERYLREYRDEMLRQLGPLHASSIDAVSRWARIWARLGHTQEAARELGTALEAAEKVYPPGASQFWAVYVSYAYVLNLAGRGKEAEVYARRALECVKDVDAKNPRRAESMAEVGISLVVQKRPGEGIPILRQSEAIYRSLPGWGPDNYQTVRVEEYLAQAENRGNGVKSEVPTPRIQPRRQSQPR